MPKYYGLLLVVCLPAGAIRLHAQNPTAHTCVANSVGTPLVRAEGFTELVGDIILTCSGGTSTAAGAPIPRANVTIFLNTNLTSRILGNGGSEALLLIDEPGTALNPRQQLCGTLNGCVVNGTGGGGTPFDGSDASRPNIFQAVPSPGNAVTFLGVPVDPPGTAGTRTYRITNIRANASGIGASAGTPGMIIASISAAPLLVSRPQQIVAFVESGMSFGASSITLPQCVDAGNITRNSFLNFSAGFHGSFKPRTAAGPAGTGPQNIPGLNYHSESGFVFPGLPAAGLADSGTHFKAIIRNLPAGVGVWVSTSNVGVRATSQAQLVPNEVGPYAPVSATATMEGTPVAQLSVAGGVATAVWEVVAADPFTEQSFGFEVFLSFPAALEASAPIAMINGSFAPVPPIFLAADAALPQPAAFPVPRFADPSSPSTFLTITPCRTNLIFPFVTARSGFDTGLALSNTSSDPFHTLKQAGACTLNFYGVNSPAAITTPPIAAGASYALLTSSASPGFQGYVIAVCNFQYAHGFAFISDVGARNLAMGYLGLIIPDPPNPRNPDPFCVVEGLCAGTGEQLGN